MSTKTETPKLTHNSQVSAKAGPRGRGPGRPFQPGTSGNVGGRPKGIPNFRVLRIFAQALAEPEVVKNAVRQIQFNLNNRWAVLPTLELAARVNRELGLGSEALAGGVTFVFQSNLEPSKLRRQATRSPTPDAHPKRSQ